MGELPPRSAASKPLQLNPGAEPEVFTGTSVEATWGEEYFQPAQFHGFKVGPFKAATLVRPGETVGQAVGRLHEELRVVAARSFDVQKQDYVARMLRMREEMTRR